MAAPDRRSAALQVAPPPASLLPKPPQRAGLVLRHRGTVFCLPGLTAGLGQGRPGEEGEDDGGHWDVPQIVCMGRHGQPTGSPVRRPSPTSRSAHANSMVFKPLPRTLADAPGWYGQPKTTTA